MRTTVDDVESWGWEVEWSFDASEGSEVFVEWETLVGWSKVAGNPFSIKGSR